MCGRYYHKNVHELKCAKMCMNVPLEVLSLNNLMHPIFLGIFVSTFCQECFRSKVCDLSDLKIYDSTAIDFVLKHKRSKLSDNPMELVFVGYDEYGKRYKCIHRWTVERIISKEIIFQELASKSIGQMHARGDNNKNRIIKNVSENVLNDVAYEDTLLNPQASCYSIINNTESCDDAV